MVGIVSYGAYVPRFRIDRKVIFSAMGWLNPATFLPGEKAVGNYDEDSLTMAVAASMDCLNGIDRDKIDGVYFASVSLPYKERQNAGIIATALDLRADIKTADFTGSNKSATTALLAAQDSVKAGSARNILVCSADCRMAKPGSPQEQAYGDAGAAFIVGNDGVIASFQGSHSLSYDFSDRWMADFDKFERTWEDRWIRDEAYGKFIPEAVSGLLQRCELSAKDVAKAAYPCLYVADHASIGKKLGFEPNQIQEHLLGSVGNTGSAYPLTLLVAALEDAKPKDRIVVASFGSGSDAFLLQATENVVDIKDKRRGIKKSLAAKQMLPSYEKFVAFRNVIEVDKGIRGETVPWDQKSLSWRYREVILGLVGSRCKKCGTPQYPAQKVCVNPACKAIDQMEPYRFSDKKGSLFTYTEDNLAFSLNPPAIYGMIDFDGGGRNWFDLTDCESGSVKVGIPVEMSLRKKFTDEARGTHFYFWKAVPTKG
ncbi:MAG: OB-fold domain-containing protein [Chloroflexi bacterium]|nr:OB-fold domain-containing protein [Chloroflexota bacterium]